MMRQNLMTFLIVFVLTTNAFSQTIEELYSQRNFEKMIEYSKSKSLTKEEYFFIGLAYFGLKDNTNAIKMYDLAIKKGLDEDYVYLYKGISFVHNKQFDKAIENYRIAIQRNPKKQTNYTELANAFFFKEQFDSALVYAYKARELEFEIKDAYILIPTIFHNKRNFNKALEEYYISASLIDKSSDIYLELLLNIGFLEYSFKRNYSNSIKAYSEMLTIEPTAYIYYDFLIRSYYANEEYSKGDSLFDILKEKYKKNELPEDMMKVKGVVIDMFLWEGQNINVMKYYKKPEKFAESIYQFYLFSKKSEKQDQFEKRILTEKTATEIDGVNHLLCAYDKLGTHYTYPIGWKTDDIDYKELKNNVLLILNGKLKPASSSNFETTNKKKKKK